MKFCKYCLAALCLVKVAKTFRRLFCRMAGSTLAREVVTLAAKVFVAAVFRGTQKMPLTLNRLESSRPGGLLRGKKTAESFMP